MKKIILLLAVCGLVFSTAEAKKKKSKDSKDTVALTNETDSMSYALGVNIGTELTVSLENIPGGSYNLTPFLQGFEAAIKKEPTLMTNEYAQEYFQAYAMEAYEKQNQNIKSEGEKFLAENKKKKDVHETASGLQYTILRDADGAKPASETDVVKVHYEGYLLDGTKFDSSVDRGAPIDFALNQVIRGWTEGVMLMPVGAKYKFFIPYQLAYGERGAGNAIPPYSTLVFEVELLDINPDK